MNGYERREIGEFEWFAALSNISFNHYWFNRTRNLLHFTYLWYPEYWWMKRQEVFRRSYFTILSDVVLKRISISVISNSSIILEQTNSLTSPNDNGFNWIPSSVSDGMSKSNSIINQHSPMSLCLYYRNCHHLLWLGSEKEDLINQSSLSFILLIVNFGSTVSS